MMRSLVCSSLALMGLSAALAPAVAHAQAAAPAGYAPSAANGVMMMGMDGKPLAVQPVMAVQPAPAPHTHKFRTMCASCMKKTASGAGRADHRLRPLEERRLPDLPGFARDARSRHHGSRSAGSGGRGSRTGDGQQHPRSGWSESVRRPDPAVYDPSSTPEPTPVGVMQTNYAQPGAAPAAPSSIPTASSLQPGHAIAAAGPGANPAPFQHKPTSSKNPHIIGHLLGYSGIGSEWRDQRAQKKAQAHASIPYNNEGTTINELPASMVFGRQH